MKALADVESLLLTRPPALSFLCTLILPEVDAGYAVVRAPRLTSSHARRTSRLEITTDQRQAAHSLILLLGHITVAEFARRALAEADQNVEHFLARHQRGDWGEVDATGKAHNDHAATHDLDVTSYYRLTTGVIVTIATESDRVITRVELHSGS